VRRVLGVALLLLAAGCQHIVSDGTMEACKQMCAPHPVKQCTPALCECAYP